MSFRSLAFSSAAALTSTWVLYPLGVAAVAALRRRKPAAAPAPAVPASKVSVVLATREDIKIVRARIDNLLGADYDANKLEVVVAMDAAATPAAVSEFGRIHPGIRVVAGDPEGGKAANLNAGVRAAQGDVLVFADSHQRFAPDAIARLVAALADPRVGAASGSLELRERAGARSLIDVYWRFERWLRHNEATIHSTVGVSGAIYAMRREHWQPLPPGLILDDVYTPMRLVLDGHRVAFVQEARAYDTRQPTPAQEYRRKVRTLTGNVQLCAWLPRILNPARNPIWVQFVFHKLMRLLTPYFLLVVAGGSAHAAAEWLDDRLVYVIFGTSAVGILLAGASPRTARSVCGVVYQGALLQAATVNATINGVRGKWDVWSR